MICPAPNARPIKPITIFHHVAVTIPATTPTMPSPSIITTMNRKQILSKTFITVYFIISTFSIRPPPSVA